MFGDENAENETREKLMALLNAVNNQDNRFVYLFEFSLCMLSSLIL
jgi:hypothetical protein